MKNHINKLVKELKDNKQHFLKKSDFFTKFFVASGIAIANLYLLMPQTRKLYDYFYKNNTEVTHIVQTPINNIVLRRSRSKRQAERSGRYWFIWRSSSKEYKQLPTPCSQDGVRYI
jgi:hypothetical protein